ncbi:MAG: glycosyltransferase family 4 protein [Solirubrobacterales bacterium]|nr:glycosyltransferase family 4 protein [Solirubrobacterales bacterium]
MRVGLNLLYLAPGAGGVGTYARELLPAMLDAEPGLRLTGFVSRELPEDVRRAPWAGEVEWVELPVTVTHGPPWNVLKTVGAQWGAIPALARRRRLEVVHGLANVAPLVAPGAARVVTILDLIWLRHPGVMDARARIGTRVLTRASAHRADRILTISDFVARDVRETYGVPAERIEAIPLGFRLPPAAPAAPEAEVRAALGLGDAPVVLCVAQHREHKNLEALVRALPADAVLVLPGAETEYTARLRAADARDQVRFPGWVDAAQLEALYAMARCFVLPSLEEGFGLPVLEAMGRGVPVACSDAASLPEVAGDAALLFDPHDQAAIAQALERLLRDGDLRARLAAAGRERAAAFPWSATARRTIDAYRGALASRRR